MSPIISTHTANQKHLPAISHFKVISNIGMAMVISILLLSTVGCVARRKNLNQQPVLSLVDTKQYSTLYLFFERLQIFLYF